jgi:hypothetical protein
VHPWSRQWRREGDTKPGVRPGGHAAAAAPATWPRRCWHPHHRHVHRRVTALPTSSRSGYVAVPIPPVLSHSILLRCNYCELRFCARVWLPQSWKPVGRSSMSRGLCSHPESSLMDPCDFIHCYILWLHVLPCTRSRFGLDCWMDAFDGSLCSKRWYDYFLSVILAISEAALPFQGLYIVEYMYIAMLLNTLMCLLQ